MDIVMPKLNGIEALKAIKEFDPAARIVMCTAVGQEQLVSSPSRAVRKVISSNHSRPQKF